MKKLLLAFVGLMIAGCTGGGDSTDKGFDVDDIPSIISALESEDLFTRQGAAIALSNKGPDAAEAVPALVKVLRDEGEAMEVRSEAAKALGKIGSREQAVIDALTEFSTYKKDKGVRENSKASLEQLQS